MPRPTVSWFVGPESQWFWGMLQFIVVGVSLYFIYRQIRIQSHANMLTALFELARKWDSVRSVDARRHVCENHKTQPANRAINAPEESIAAFFEQIGLFMKKGAFTADIIWEEYSYYIEYYWPMLEPCIKEFRRVERDDSWDENFEDLYKQMQRLSKQRGVYVFTRDGSDVEKFIRGEVAFIQDRKARMDQERPRPAGTRQPDGEADQGA